MNPLRFNMAVPPMEGGHNGAPGGQEARSNARIAVSIRIFHARDEADGNGPLNPSTVRKARQRVNS